MIPHPNRSTLPVRAGRTSVIAVYLVIAAEFFQFLFSTPHSELRPLLFGLHVTYLILFTVVMRAQLLHYGLLNLYFAVQSAIVVTLLLSNSELGVATALFVLLAFQASLVFAGSVHWLWVGLFSAFMAAPLIFHFGALDGLARALMPMAGSVVVSAYIIVNREIEEARLKSQAMLNDLETLHSQLQKYASEAEELAIMEERNRLARELHDSVSQTLFSMALNTRSAEIILKRKPSQARPQLENLQRLVQNALAEMRRHITQLHPKSD